jgi:hypothetical protein
MKFKKNEVFENEKNALLNVNNDIWYHYRKQNCNHFNDWIKELIIPEKPVKL